MLVPFDKFRVSGLILPVYELPLLESVRGTSGYKSGNCSRALTRRKPEGTRRDLGKLAASVHIARKNAATKKGG